MKRPVWTTSCPDWAERLVARKSIIPPPIFPDAAERALNIFKSLRVVDVPGKPTFGECSEEWVFDYVRAIFGAYEAETGKQLIREYGLLISKKNTKSTIAAGIMLTATILCWREDEEHLILAPTKEVADNSFKPAASMVQADPKLSALFNVQRNIRTIVHRLNGNSLKVVAADSGSVSGKKAGRIMFDELWLFGKDSHAASMFMEALGGQVSRDEGWVIYLTTQSDDSPAGVFKEKLDYWRKVRDGEIKDKKTLPVLYEFPPEMVKSKSYLVPANFYITNPNLGRSVSEEWLEDNLKKNQEKTDGSFQQFLAKHLNIEIGLNLRSDRWAGADFWLENGYEEITLDYILANSEVVTVGIDGGGLKDLLGIAVIGRHSKTKDWLHWGHAWAHPSVLERQKQIAPTLLDFAKQGHLTLVENIGEDVEAVADIVEKIERAGLLDLIGVDTAGISDIDDAIRSRKIHDVENRIKGIPQGWRMTGTLKNVERNLAGGTFKHGAQPLLAWAVSNAKVVTSGNAVLITKEASGSGKIDPVMALLDAAMLMGQNPQPRKKKLVLAVGG